MRVGIGYDSHKFSDGRKLVLGGVKIPHPRGLAGHALTDALLGAAGLGDMGHMFPPTEPQWRDADSIDLLKRAYLGVVEAGFDFVSADVTIIAEQPILGRYLDPMRQKLGEALVAGLSKVSVKAKTNDGMGWIGRGEGVAVIAVAVVE